MCDLKQIFLFSKFWFQPGLLLLCGLLQVEVLHVRALASEPGTWDLISSWRDCGHVFFVLTWWKSNKKQLQSGEKTVFSGKRAQTPLFRWVRKAKSGGDYLPNDTHVANQLLMAKVCMHYASMYFEGIRLARLEALGCGPSLLCGMYPFILEEINK